MTKEQLKGINWVRVMQIVRTIGALITSAANIYFIWHIIRGAH